MIWRILCKIWNYFFISECERCDFKLNSKTSFALIIVASDFFILLIRCFHQQEVCNYSDTLIEIDTISCHSPSAFLN